MELLVTFSLTVALFVALEIFWCQPAWLRGLFDAARGVEHQPGSAQLLPDGNLSALSFVHERLDILAAELERLEHEPSTFARAFRTHVAQSAYQDLLDDVVRLANTSPPTAGSPLSDVTVVEIALANSLTPLQEELEV